MKNSALILVNLQIDYCPGGAMEVPNGDQVIPIANQLMDQFDQIIAVIDWHPANHISFAGNHPWRHIGQTITIDGLEQELLPFHCVKESFGAHFHPSLDKGKITKIIELGTEVSIDNYSCFFDVDQRRTTPLDSYLAKLNIENLFIMGLATEKGVLNSVLDGNKLSYKTFIIKDGCRAWNKQEGVEKKAYKAMENAGGLIINVDRIMNQYN